MGRQRHLQAKLAGWKGPFYPVSIDEVARAHDLSGCDNGAEMAAKLKKIHGFVGFFRPERAADGYGWYWLFEFRAGMTGRAALAMPWGFDRDRVGGTALDRSPAIYTKGRWVGDDVPDRIAKLVARAWTL